MSDSSSIPLAETPATGHLENLFESPEPRVGDDQQATSIRRNPLHRRGTPARNQFELQNEMNIEIRFKIYTQKTVNINIPSQSVDRVGAGKKGSKSGKLNLIESRAINSKYLEIKTCLFGKSLNDFKDLVLNACEQYEGGMKAIILNRNSMPKVMWKTSVGRSKHVLDDFAQYQAFVTALEKSVKKQGLLVIENHNVEVQENEGNKMLIASVNADEPDVEESKVDAELHVMANKIFSQAGIGGYAGGDGTVLTVPWNPAFRYRLTYTAAWIWAKGVMANLATQYIPPNTREFNEEIKKSEWKHPDMGVDERVQMRLQGHPRKLQEVQYAKASSSTSRKTVSMTNSGVDFDSKPKWTHLTNCQIIDLTEDIDTKPIIKNFHGLSEQTESKPEVKKIKKEIQQGDTFDDPITVSSDTESNHSESDDEESEIQLDFSPSHTVAMEMFLADCELPYEDVKTREILKEAGIISWTDLIPSIQMTESTLTSKGIDREIASRLMTHAKARYYEDCKLFILEPGVITMY
ncbi:hypothetical protein DFH28DRAFT_908529 [Melampsora americana]|nr:hypothetical protein DFH28DRAFT_908529 [Melampsora americana]